MKHDKDNAAVLFFPPGIPLLTVLLGIALNHLVPVSITFGLEALARYIIGGVIILSAIGFLGLRAVLLFRKEGQNENPWKPTPAIEVRGPFRITRNPMYLQMVVVCIGIGVILANGWIFLLTPVVAVLLQKLAIEPEERYLEGKFGQEYRCYKSRVRRWL